MQKYATVLWVVLIGLLIGGCGGGSSSVTPTTVYVLPASLAPPSTHMGGAIQGGAISGKFSNYSVSTRAGVAGSAGFTDTSATTVALFNLPTDIATDGTKFYIADYLNNAIRSMDSTGVVTTLAYTDATGAAILFNRPTGITTITATDGIKLYVVDSGSNTIRFIDVASKKVTAIIGSTAGIAGSVDTKVPADARFNAPTGITTDGVNLYVTDSGNHAIRRINISTMEVTTVAGAPGTAGSADGTQGVARFNLPARITTDGTNLYVTDFTNRTLRKIDIIKGEVSTIAGKAGTAPGTDDADAAVGTDARFNQPNGITTDGANLYVTDSYNNTIRRISLTAPYSVVKIAGITYGQAGSPGHVDSAAGIPSFDTPIGITTDGTSLYVADRQNNIIRKIQ